MRVLACLLILAMPAFPALADETVPDKGTVSAQVAVPQANADAAAPNVQSRKKRALACPACVTEEMPSFAIRPATDGQAVRGQTGGTPSPDSGADVSAGAASEPPVNFSFAASGQSNSRRDRYRGGVYVAAPF